MSDATALPSDPPVHPGVQAMASTLARAIDSGSVSAADDVVVLYDLARLDVGLAALKQAFPAGTLHTIAVKANPLLRVLERIRDRGLGVEVASIGEVALALESGFAPDHIVFDSPAKTRAELSFALEAGLTINANCLDEIDRIGDLRSGAPHSKSKVGIRVNPAIGGGEIDSTSTAKQASKFGAPIDHRPDALEARLRAEWVTGMHVHIGSQGMAVEQLVEGVGRVADLYTGLQVSAGLHRFNVGGGLPVAYRPTDRAYTFEGYVAALRERAPGIFTPRTALGTEFGRAIHANNGWVASRIEYVLDHGDGVPTLVVHVGADMFVREAYRPDDWHHDMTVADQSGSPRVGETRRFRVAGPLCFAGDYLSDGVDLPADTAEGDFLLIHDAGAYTFSMWSVYNSRRFPKVLGYAQGDAEIEVLRAAQDPSDLVAFWSPPRA